MYLRFDILNFRLGVKSYKDTSIFIKLILKKNYI